MPKMSLGINFFCGEPFRQQQKKMDGKSRFGELSTEEIQEIIDNAVPVTTKEGTKFEIRLFSGSALSFL